MALVQDSTGLFLEPTSGQYYSPYTAPRGNMFGGGMFGNQGGNNFGFTQQQGMGGFMGSAMNNQYRAPEGLMNFDGKSFVPFTGNMAGISQGKRSVVDAMMRDRAPFQYNAPSLAQLFPALQGNMQGGMPMQNMQPSSGAGRFTGGLLGSMPTPVSSETTQAPSSGAGRFL